MKVTDAPIGVTIIIVICYMVGEVYKVVFPKENLKRLIPIVMATLGAILGILIYCLDKTLLFNVNSVLSAGLIGIISGTSSTGENQIIKQIFKKEGEKENDGII